MKMTRTTAKNHTQGFPQLKMTLPNFTKDDKRIIDKETGETGINTQIYYLIILL